jgi:hypothetical protein
MSRLFSGEEKNITAKHGETKKERNNGILEYWNDGPRK